VNAALLFARLLLAAVLGVAAIAKTVDRAGSRDALAGFGLSVPLARIAAFVLPAAELVIAVGLLFGSTAQAGAIAALVVLGLFTGAVTRALLRGEHVDCHCFGQLSEGPAGIGTLVRNGLLAALAAFVVVAPGAPGPGVLTWLGRRSDADRVAFWLGLTLLALVAAGAWFARELLRAQGRLMLRVEELEGTPNHSLGLPIGTPAPSFSVRAHGGGELTLDGLLALGQPLLIAFSDVQCGLCDALVPLIQRTQHDLRGRATVALLSKGASPKSEAAWIEHALEHVGIADSHDVNLSYGAVGTPAAVLVSRDGRIDSELTAGLASVSALIADAVGQREGTIASTRGDDGFELRVTQIAGGV
jgi:peroxiredoxin